ncbi:DUF3429 domain-containing protein [Methylophilus aquaticus]|uniref:DUF3429 domain-containing protein n=1 Tax=Methylophilus aquaticus TaxID=1971610 RepID=A0ABT9JWG3_9PROT|nr:DUF3429 domain-containing protein [Methylophilus aquaticus]MDP8568883.1 DUF3429 domain-containing protein [Methylophilus aquaticus]
MNKQQIKLASILTIVGALPFVAAVAAQLAGVSAYHTSYFSLTYGAVILSFLGGMHWGVFLSQAHVARINLLVSSNLFALLAWLSLLMLVPLTQYLIQITCFLALLLIDRKLAADGMIERWFYNLRKQVTLVVVVCLATLAVLTFKHAL